MYALINVKREYNGLVDGALIQWCSACTLREATRLARSTERVNSNRITVAVIDDYYSGLWYFKGRKRLDI